MSKPKRVQYKRSLICHLDLLGFRELIRTKKPGEISKMLRLFSDAVKPLTREVEVKALGTRQFVAFSEIRALWCMRASLMSCSVIPRFGRMMAIGRESSKRSKVFCTTSGERSLLH
jgi:hypothetical protein